MHSTPNTGNGATPTPVRLTLRPPSACPGSEGWHDRRLDALDALSRSSALDLAAAQSRADKQPAPVATLAHVLLRLVLSTKAPGSGSKYADPGQVCETREQLSERTRLSVDQLYRAIRALRAIGAVIEVVAPLTPNHQRDGRAPVYCLPWLFDHDWLRALASGRPVEVEAIDWPTIDAPELPTSRGRASAPPAVDNHPSETSRGRASAGGGTARVHPSSVYLGPFTELVEGQAPQTAETVEDSQTPTDTPEVDADPSPSALGIDENWLAEAARHSGTTVADVRGAVLSVFAELDADLSTLPPGLSDLSAWLGHPDRETRWNAKISLADRARRALADIEVET